MDSGRGVENEKDGGGKERREKWKSKWKEKRKKR